MGSKIFILDPSAWGLEVGWVVGRLQNQSCFFFLLPILSERILSAGRGSTRCGVRCMWECAWTGENQMWSASLLPRFLAGSVHLFCESVLIVCIHTHRHTHENAHTYPSPLPSDSPTFQRFVISGRGSKYCSEKIYIQSLKFLCCWELRGAVLSMDKIVNKLSSRKVILAILGKCGRYHFYAINADTFCNHFAKKKLTHPSL